MALTGVNLLLAALGSMLLLFLMRADVYEGKPLALSAPLRGGTFYVMGGGGNWSVNHHAFIPYQRYAMDIVQVGALGFRAAGTSPVTLEEYRIFGAEILAPCEGEVLTTRERSAQPEAIGPRHESIEQGTTSCSYAAGIAWCSAHMQPGSVTVRVGETVKVGQLLGRVGNSGSTMEPHLHVHAVEGRQVDGRGIAAPVLVDGAFLIKGDTFTK